MTRNELYGSLHPATREWKEGLMSVTFRDMSNNKVNKHQWIVLDGDIDAEWIESMNTVMVSGWGWWITCGTSIGPGGGAISCSGLHPVGSIRLLEIL